MLVAGKQGDGKLQIACCIHNNSSNPEGIHFTIMSDKEKQGAFTFQSLEPAHF